MAKNNEIAIRQNENSLRPLLQSRAEESYATPYADIYETPDAYVLNIDMPGASKEGMSVAVDKGVLTVKAAVEPYHTPNATLLFREIQTTGYLRAFNLGEGINRSNIDARYENGVLILKLFKSENQKPREIPIQ